MYYVQLKQPIGGKVHQHKAYLIFSMIGMHLFLCGESVCTLRKLIMKVVRTKF